MSRISDGRYWDKALSLVDGCTPCSPGCDHCWSASIERRFLKGSNYAKDYLVDATHPPAFNGKVVTRPDRLDIPLRTRKPTVFAIWNDLFHEDVSDEFRDDAYAVMHGCDRHTYLILTKRPDNLLRYSQTHYLPGYQGREHIWHGLTVCNQAEAAEKVPEFLKVPGKKFLSIEPMLGPISFRWMQGISRTEATGHLDILKGISCIILGGEISTKARPMHPDWVRSVRDQCQAAGVPFFFKQWGKNKGYICPSDYAKQGTSLFGVQEFLLAERVDTVKTRLLDGREWNELPWREGK